MWLGLTQPAVVMESWGLSCPAPPAPLAMGQPESQQNTPLGSEARATSDRIQSSLEIRTHQVKGRRLLHGAGSGTTCLKAQPCWNGAAFPGRGRCDCVPITLLLGQLLVVILNNFTIHFENHVTFLNRGLYTGLLTYVLLPFEFCWRKTNAISSLCFSP